MKRPTKQIEVTVEELTEKVLYLNQHLGNGSLGNTKFDAHLRLPDYSIVVEVNGKKYMVTSQSLISSIVEHARKKHAK